MALEHNSATKPLHVIIQLNLLTADIDENRLEIVVPHHASQSRGMPARLQWVEGISLREDHAWCDIVPWKHHSVCLDATNEDGSRDIFRADIFSMIGWADWFSKSVLAFDLRFCRAVLTLDLWLDRQSFASCIPKTSNSESDVVVWFDRRGLTFDHHFASYTFAWNVGILI
jgi:hypothetical protein